MIKQRNIKLTGLVGARGKDVPNVFKGEIRFVKHLHKLVPSKDLPQGKNFVLVTDTIDTIVQYYYGFESIMAVIAISGGITSHGMVISRENIDWFEKETKEIESMMSNLVVITSIIGNHHLLKDGDNVQVEIRDGETNVTLI